MAIQTPQLRNRVLQGLNLALRMNTALWFETVLVWRGDHASLGLSMELSFRESSADDIVNVVPVEGLQVQEHLPVHLEASFVTWDGRHQDAHVRLQGREIVVELLWGRRLHCALKVHCADILEVLRWDLGLEVVQDVVLHDLNHNSHPSLVLSAAPRALVLLLGGQGIRSQSFERIRVRHSFPSPPLWQV